MMAALDQFVADGLEVVDLAIEHNDDVAGCVEHRLMAVVDTSMIAIWVAALSMLVSLSLK